MAKAKPLVSVLVPAYNQAQFIGQTIESVLAQTYSDWELLVRDDCSSDATWDVVKSYEKKDPRIRVSRNAVNQGLIGNWERLIADARGKYLVFLEGDDVLYVDNIAVRLECFKQYPEVGMVYSDFDIIDGQGVVRRANYYHYSRVKTFQNEQATPADCLFSRVGLLSSYSQLMIRAVILESVGLPRTFEPNEKVFLPSDWDFSTRILTTVPSYFIDEALLGYRRHGGNTSADTLKVSRQLRLILDDFEKRFADDSQALSGIIYQRGKTHYFNTLYYLEKGNNPLAWKQWRQYMRYFPYWGRDFLLNLKLFIRLFLPPAVNRSIVNMAKL